MNVGERVGGGGLQLDPTPENATLKKPSSIRDKVFEC